MLLAAISLISCAPLAGNSKPPPIPTSDPPSGALRHVLRPSADVRLALLFNWQLADPATGAGDVTQRERGIDDLVFGAQTTIPGTNKAVPGVAHLYYYSWRLDGGASIGQGIAPFLNTHPDWIVYQNDRQTPAWGGGSPIADLNRAPLDFTNPAVQRYMMDRFLTYPITTGGFAGVAFDVCSTINYDHRAGVYRTAGQLTHQAIAGSTTIRVTSPIAAGTSIALGTASNMEYITVQAAVGTELQLAHPLLYGHASGEWVGRWHQQYDGQPLDTAYRRATIKAFSHVVHLIRAVKPNAIVAINDIMNIWDGSTDQKGIHAWDYWRDLVPYADVILEEAGFTNTADPANMAYITDATSRGGLTDPWHFKVNDYLWAEQMGKAVMIVNYEPYTVSMNTTTYNRRARFDLQWALANYFMARGKYTYLVWRGHEQTPGEVYWEPEYSRARLGAPVDDPYRSQGVWERDYSHGLTIVNPSSSNRQVITLPQGMYHDLYGHAISQYVMLPHSGLVLLKVKREASR